MRVFFKSSSFNIYLKFTRSKFITMAKHSEVKLCKFENYNVQVLPALEDNFMYLINKNESSEAFVVDPVHAEFIHETVKLRNLNLTKVLTTHHHWDHAGGNEKLKVHYPDIKIYGKDDRINGLTNQVNDGDYIHLEDLKIKCMFTPCHTSGHICYYLEDLNPSVFTGDTLFIGGCGRFFEGDGSQMFKSLTALSNLPDQTQVFCGHEYSVSNLKYGKHVEPGNESIIKQLEVYEKDRSNKQPTVPSTIGLEKQINVFMRVQEASVQQHCHVTTGDPIKTIDYLRNEKNNFKA